jgi:hypothetical protein
VTIERGHGFRAVGYVEKKFVPPSGKVAFLTISVPGWRGDQKIEMRTFDADMIVEVGALGVGQTVTVTAGVESNKLLNKAKQAVSVDGRDVWTMALTIRTLKVEGDGRQQSLGTKPEDATPKSDAEKAADKREDSVDW